MELPPSPPAEKATAREHQAGQARTDCWKWDWGVQRPGAGDIRLSVENAKVTHLLDSVLYTDRNWNRNAAAGKGALGRADAKTGTFS